jgi:hypothetical protein
MTVEHGKLEKGVSELKQELLEEGELEDGELSGGWESGEDDDDDDDNNAGRAVWRRWNDQSSNSRRVWQPIG